MRASQPSAICSRTDSLLCSFIFDRTLGALLREIHESLEVLVVSVYVDCHGFVLWIVEEPEAVTFLPNRPVRLKSLKPERQMLKNSKIVPKIPGYRLLLLRRVLPSSMMMRAMPLSPLTYGMSSYYVYFSMTGSLMILPTPHDFKLYYTLSLPVCIQMSDEAYAVAFWMISFASWARARDAKNMLFYPASQFQNWLARVIALCRTLLFCHRV